MKKDIKWLKSSIQQNLDFYNDNDEEWQMAKVRAYAKSLDLINQLDEPEVTLDRAFEEVSKSYPMTKEEIWRHLEQIVAHGGKVTYGEPEVLSQEWIDDNKEMYLMNDMSENAVPGYKLQNLLVPKQEITFDQVHDKLREESILSEKSFDYYWNCINDNVEIDEPGNLLVSKQEKPVIPKYVADWIEAERGTMSNWKLPSRFISDSKYKKDQRRYKWSQVEGNMDKFMSALINSYEVAEEPLYYVINNEKYFLLAKDKAHGFVFSTGGNSRLGGPKNISAIFELTEQEIKDYDERYWAFAKPVEEMEE